MELNRLLDKKLTPEHKRKFERDKDKFKTLNIIIILPIITAILGVFMESIVLVTASLVIIIVCLLFVAFSTKSRNVIYEEMIIPIVLQERFRDCEPLKKDLDVENEFDMSGLGKEYSRFEDRNSFLIHEDRYTISISKIVTKNKKIQDEENEDYKEFVKSFSGVFAYFRLPRNIDIDIEVKENYKTKNQITQIDKTDVERVIMNNIEFDTQYDVRASDPAVARKILSIGVMARILEINRKLGRVINFSIKNNTLFILVDYDEFLEFSSSKKNEYVNEEKANENMDVVEIIDYFARYMVNLTEI